MWMILAQIAISYAVSYFTAPDGPNSEGAKSSGGTPQDILGTTAPTVYATARVTGKEIWRLGNDLIEVAVETENEGGKGGPDPGSTTTYSYFFTGADLIGAGRYAAVRRVWADTVLIYDAGAGGLESIIASNQRAKQFTFYSGALDQNPNHLIEAEKGVGNVPAYRGFAYVVWDNLPCDDYGKRKPVLKYELVSEDNGAPEKIGDTVLIEGAEGAGGTSSAMYDDKMVVVTSEGRAGPYPRQAWGRVVYIDMYAQQTESFYNLKYNNETQNWEVTAENGYIGAATPSVVTQLDNPGHLAGYPTGVLDYLYLNEYNGAGMFLAATIKPFATNATFFNVSIKDGEAVVIEKNNIGESLIIGKIGTVYGSGQVTKFIDLSDIGVPTNEFCEMTWHGGGVIYILTTDWVMIEVDHFSGDVIDSYQVGNMLPTNGNAPRHSYLASKIYGDIIWYYGRRNGGDYGVLTKYDISSRKIIKQYVDPVGVPIASAGAIGWQVVDNILTATVRDPYITRTTKSERWNLEPIPKVTATLSDVVGDIWTTSNRLTPGDMDLSVLTDEVNGYTTAAGSLRKHTEPLQQAYRFDAVESEYKLKAVKRGQPPVVTIPLDDLGAHLAGSAPPISIKSVLSNDKDLPQKCEVTYTSYERQYDNSVQSANRLSGTTDNILKITWPITLTDQQAADAAQVALFSQWAERQLIDIVLPPKYMYLEPTDVIKIEAGTLGNYELRLVDVNNRADGIIEVRGITQSFTTYKPNATPSDPGVGGSDGVALPGETVSAYIDAPLMDELDNSPGWLCATTGPTDGWPGGLNYRSVDGGQTYATLNTYSSHNRCTIGNAINTIETTPPEIWYRGKPLHYRKVYGDIFSISPEQLLAGQNTLAYGMAGRWEIIQAQTANPLDDRNIELNDLRRGKYGTSRHSDSHAENDLLVRLDSAAVQFVKQNSSEINIERLLKAVTAGATVSAAPSVTFTNTGENLKPQPPVYLRGTRPELDWLLSFVPQTRFGYSNWWRGLPVPVGETTEKYRIRVFDGDTAVRTWEQSDKTLTYTEADQITDFGSVQNSITFDVAQWSDVMGYGYTTEHTA